MNCTNNILSNVNIRKAIDYSIDKENIIATVYNGKYYSADFPLDFGMWLYTPENTSLGYNPDQAKQILIDDGWEYKKGYWQKTQNYKTTRLSLTLTVNSDNSQRMQVAQIIKNNLEAIGIKIKISTVSNNVYKNILENKSYELIIGGTNVGLSPELDTYLGENNIANYTNEEVKTILNDIANIKDENLLKEKYKKLAEIYKNESPYKSLYINKKTIIYSTNLMGEITPNSYNIFYNIEKWYREI